MNKLFFLFWILVLLLPVADAMIIEPGIQFEPSASNAIYNITLKIKGLTNVTLNSTCLIMQGNESYGEYCDIYGSPTYVNLPTSLFSPELIFYTLPPLNGSNITTNTVFNYTTVDIFNYTCDFYVNGSLYDTNFVTQNGTYNFTYNVTIDNEDSYISYNVTCDNGTDTYSQQKLLYQNAYNPTLTFYNNSPLNGSTITDYTTFYYNVSEMINYECGFYVNYIQKQFINTTGWDNYTYNYTPTFYNEDTLITFTVSCTDAAESFTQEKILLQNAYQPVRQCSWDFLTLLENNLYMNIIKVIALILFLSGFVFYSQDVRIGLMLHFFMFGVYTSLVYWLSTYKNCTTFSYVIPLTITLIFLVLMVFSLFPTEKFARRGGTI